MLILGIIAPDTSCFIDLCKNRHLKYVFFVLEFDYFCSQKLLHINLLLFLTLNLLFFHSFKITLNAFIEDINVPLTRHALLQVSVLTNFSTICKHLWKIAERFLLFSGEMFKKLALSLSLSLFPSLCMVSHCTHMHN